MRSSCALKRVCELCCLGGGSWQRCQSHNKLTNIHLTHNKIMQVKGLQHQRISQQRLTLGWFLVSCIRLQLYPRLIAEPHGPWRWLHSVELFLVHRSLPFLSFAPPTGLLWCVACLARHPTGHLSRQPSSAPSSSSCWSRSLSWLSGACQAYPVQSCSVPACCTAALLQHQDIPFPCSVSSSHKRTNTRGKVSRNRVVQQPLLPSTCLPNRIPRSSSSSISATTTHTETSALLHRHTPTKDHPL